MTFIELFWGTYTFIRKQRADKRCRQERGRWGQWTLSKTVLSMTDFWGQPPQKLKKIIKIIHMTNHATCCTVRSRKSGCRQNILKKLWRIFWRQPLSRERTVQYVALLAINRPFQHSMARTHNPRRWIHRSHIPSFVQSKTKHVSPFVLKPITWEVRDYQE